MLIYIIQNIHDNKIYVGQTTVSLEARWSKHCSDARGKKYSYPLYHAMNKYGINSFEAFEIGVANTQEELDNLEKLWIILLRTRNREYGYNLKEGGRGGKNSLETIQKMKAAKKGKPNGRLGKHHSEETKNKMRLAAMGNHGGLGRKRSEETKKRISIAKTGVLRSMDTRKKISEGRIKAFAKRKLNKCLLTAPSENMKI